MRALPLAAALALAISLAPHAAAAEPPALPEGDVFLPAFYACTWNGSYKPVASAAGFTVWAYSCDPPT